MSSLLSPHVILFVIYLFCVGVAWYTHANSKLPAGSVERKASKLGLLGSIFLHPFLFMVTVEMNAD